MIQADLFLHAAYTIFVPMKTPVDIWAELGARLSSFGQDAASREVIARACQKNDWFEPEEIVDAVRSIREEFLSRDKIERWLACYERPATLPSRTVLVVMAGNIPLVGFFDLLCVVTAGHRCLVKMSSKDAVLMSFVIDQLKRSSRVSLSQFMTGLHLSMPRLPPAAIMPIGIFAACMPGSELFCAVIAIRSRS